MLSNRTLLCGAFHVLKWIGGRALCRKRGFIQNEPRRHVLFYIINEISLGSAGRGEIQWFRLSK